jgi:hypothetical protein
VFNRLHAKCRGDVSLAGTRRTGEILPTTTARS